MSGSEQAPIVQAGLSQCRRRVLPASVRLVLDAEITPASGKPERGRRNSPPYTPKFICEPLNFSQE
jgi:hypothetical protein